MQYQMSGKWVLAVFRVALILTARFGSATRSVCVILIEKKTRFNG